MSFDGFPRRTFTFLRGLGRNNDRDWFEEHRDDYEEHYVEIAKEFVIAAGERLQKLAPKIHAEPRINGSIFRINRDMRFSRDRTPYKDHLDLWFWEAPKRKGAISGFFFRLTARRIIVGAGCHAFDKNAMAAYRKLVMAPKAGKELITAIKKVRRAGYSVEGSHYKQIPRGFDADGDRAELLKHNALFVTEDARHPETINSPRLVSWCMSHWRKMAPIHRWLADHVQRRAR